MKNFACATVNDVHVDVVLQVKCCDEEINGEIGVVMIVVVHVVKRQTMT